MKETMSLKCWLIWVLIHLTLISTPNTLLCLIQKPRLKKVQLPKNKSKVKFESKHILRSFSLHTNLPNHEDPIFECGPDPQELTNNMVDHLLKMAEEQKAILMNQFAYLFDAIDTAIEEENASDPPEEDEHGKPNELPLQKLRRLLCDYIDEFTVVGFNSGKYDVNVMKPYLLTTLKNKDPVSFVVKKNNNYMAMKGQKLKFLDMTNYLAPGYSYDKFVKAHNCDIEKGFFPYEWFDSYDKLKQTELPPQEAFYSNLKNEGISLEDYNYCQEIWRSENMESMYDFLKWYNKRDVIPFVQAIEKQKEVYEASRLDMFRDGISVPGLCMRLLFKILDHDTYFTLFGEKDKDLHQTVKDNIVGGLSIVFHRYHEVGETLLRTNQQNIPSRTCKGVVGYDANALYLWAMQQMMPTGWFVRRSAEDGFKPRTQKFTQNSFKAYRWLTYVSKANSIDIRTAFNEGEKRLGRRQIPVDGWDPKSKTVYQFHGCYWHGHECWMTQENDNEQMETRRVKTEENTEYLRQLGYKVIEMRECQWTNHKKSAAVSKILDEFAPKPDNKGMSSKSSALRINCGSSNNLSTP